MLGWATTELGKFLALNPHRFLMAQKCFLAWIQLVTHALTFPPPPPVSGFLKVKATICTKSDASLNFALVGTKTTRLGSWTTMQSRSTSLAYAWLCYWLLQAVATEKTSSGLKFFYPI